ncbi:MAG: hypothetical protein KAX49_07570 [Halanaerobiales bacterium]|nr:hypothetical protein [Halanaerobiales bacterium]
MKKLLLWVLAIMVFFTVISSANGDEDWEESQNVLSVANSLKERSSLSKEIVRRVENGKKIKADFLKDNLYVDISIDQVTKNESRAKGYDEYAQLIKPCSVEQITVRNQEQTKNIGKLYFSNGVLKYEGELFNNIPHGKGKKYSKTGILIYDGQFVNGKYEGFGKGYNENGFLLYDGEWENGLFNGKGELVNSSGDLYIGNFVSNKKQGFGVLVYGNGQKYEGEFYNDKRQGKGKYKHLNGDIYEGQWYEDKMYGMGMYFFLNGEKYNGQWFNNKMTGIGIYMFENGNIYFGKWLDNQMYGEGKYIYNDGKVQEGIWAQNKFIQAQQINTDLDNIQTNNEEYIMLGSTRDEVIKIMGFPDKIISGLKLYQYIYSSIYFDKNWKVESWYNTSKNLKVKVNNN